MSDQADKPSVLDELYGHLADATNAEEDLAGQHRQAMSEISDREDALTQELEETEEGSERAQQIQGDLDELRRAYLTIREQLGDDDTTKDPDAPHQPEDDQGDADQRSGDGDAPVAGR